MAYKSRAQRAYEWAMKHPEDRVLLMDAVNKSEWAYKWALQYPEDRIFMIDRVTESRWAYEWAVNIGNLDTMHRRVTENLWMIRWNTIFPNYLITDLWHAY